MRNITIIYKPTMKMSELIDADFHLLMLIEKLNFSLGFSEKTVDAVCKMNNFDTDCFLFLATFQSNKFINNVDEVFNSLPLEPFLHYLKCSHNNFLEVRLPNIRRKLEKLFSEENQNLQPIVIDFFDKYTKEVMEHMNYEDDVVFPYVDSLIHKGEVKKYSIDLFEETHSDIEGKVNDLKQILMKYISDSNHQGLIINVLLELYISEDELRAHQYIEDVLVIPRVKKIEEKLKEK